MYEYGVMVVSLVLSQNINTDNQLSCYSAKIPSKVRYHMCRQVHFIWIKVYSLKEDAWYVANAI